MLFQNKGARSVHKDYGKYKGEIVCLNLKPRCLWDLGANSTDSGEIGTALATTEEIHTSLQGLDWVIGRL